MMGRDSIEPCFPHLPSKVSDGPWQFCRDFSALPAARFSVSFAGVWLLIPFVISSMRSIAPAN
jgi:hypothetical protein